MIGSSYDADFEHLEVVMRLHNHPSSEARLIITTPLRKWIVALFLEARQEKPSVEVFIHFPETLTDDHFPGRTEKLFGSMVEVNHPPIMIQEHQSIGNTLKKAEKESFGIGVHN